MILPADETAWRGRLRRRLTLDLYTRYGTFWERVAGIREHWQVMPVEDVPPEPEFHVECVKLMSRQQMPERFHLPDSIARPDVDGDWLGQPGSVIGLANSEEIVRLVQMMDWRTKVAMFLRDLQELWCAEFADDMRSGTNILGWMSWTPFLSACVKFDPPAGRLLEFADHDDHVAAAITQQPFWQDASVAIQATRHLDDPWRTSDLSHVARYAANLSESYRPSTGAPPPAAPRGRPRTDELEDVQAALWKRQGLTYLEVAKRGGWESHAESMDTRDRKNRVIKRVKSGERILASRINSGQFSPLPNPTCPNYSGERRRELARLPANSGGLCSMQTVSQSTLSKRASLECATYSLAEYAALMGVSYTAAQAEAQAGRSQVTPVRVGRQYRFPKAIVNRLLGIDPDAADASRDAA